MLRLAVLAAAAGCQKLNAKAQRSQDAKRYRNSIAEKGMFRVTIWSLFRLLFIILTGDKIEYIVMRRLDNGLGSALTVFGGKGTKRERGEEERGLAAAYSPTPLPEQYHPRS